MALYAIADLHLSLGADKPMDVFWGWKDYVPRLKANWNRLVKPEDTVVLPGDISWAMKLENAIEDFSFIDRLPGRKIILKGNHDYWWTTVSKMNAFCAAQGFGTIHFLNNNSYLEEDVAICGTRSWLFDVGQPHDLKVMNRELGRLRSSLESAQGAEKLVFLHYPPLYPTGNAQEVVALLHEFGVRECWYGHLHGGSIRGAIQGEVDGIRYRLISADALGFCPLRIR
ncbi:MAG TPA: metallophosphoesterase [Candidatus Pygmaiobacter gallistercoris]|nr:metallophosphoesterase [Candidatus Pygmaiobacter gallistercoris]